MKKKRLTAAITTAVLIFTIVCSNNFEGIFRVSKAAEHVHSNDCYPAGCTVHHHDSSCYGYDEYDVYNLTQCDGGYASWSGDFKCSKCGHSFDRRTDIWLRYDSVNNNGCVDYRFDGCPNEDCDYGDTTIEINKSDTPTKKYEVDKFWVPNWFPTTTEKLSKLKSSGYLDGDEECKKYGILPLRCALPTVDSLLDEPHLVCGCVEGKSYTGDTGAKLHCTANNAVPLTLVDVQVYSPKNQPYMSFFIWDCRLCEKPIEKAIAVIYQSADGHKTVPLTYTYCPSCKSIASYCFNSYTYDYGTYNYAEVDRHFSGGVTIPFTFDVEEAQFIGAVEDCLIDINNADKLAKLKKLIPNTWNAPMWGSSYTVTTKSSDVQEITPVCNQVVVSLVPKSSNQTINAGESPNVLADATFLDGHSETVTCTLSGYNSSVYNETQNCTLSYGSYSGTAKNATPFSTPITITVNGYFILSTEVSPASAGSITPNNPSVLANSNITLTATPNAGYSFAEWRDSVGRVGDSNPISITMPSKAYSIWAIYTPNQYTVSFNPNGGVCSVDNKSVTFSQEYGDLPVPEKEGYSFVEWQLDGAGILSSSIVTTASNHSLIAKWSAKTYTVNFDPCDGTCDTPSKNVEFNSQYGALPIPVKEGYEFTGWYTKSSGGTGIEESTLVTTAREHTLYAHWKPLKYTISFDSDGGSECEQKIVSYNSSLGELPTPAKEGHSFKGWFLDDSEVTASTVCQFTTDVTLKAKWVKNNYTVTLLGTGADASETVSTWEYGEPVTINLGTKPASCITSWSIVSDDGSVKTETWDAIHTFDMPASNLVITANWKIITGISASLSDSFKSRYSSVYNNGAYCIEPALELRPEDVDTVIHFDDGSTKVTSDVTFSSSVIDRVGDNTFTITLNGIRNASNYEYTTSVTIVGYSKSLDALMEALGVTTYTDLSAKVSDIQSALADSNATIQQYQKGLQQAKEVLDSAGYNVELNNGVSADVSAIIVGIQKSIEQTNEYKNQLVLIQQAVNAVLTQQGDSTSDDGLASTILNQVNTVLNNCISTQAQLTELQSFSSSLKSLLGLSDSASLNDVIQATVDLQKSVERAQKDLQSYSDTITYLSELLGEADSISTITDLSVKLDTVMEKFRTTTALIQQLQSKAVSLANRASALLSESSQSSQQTTTIKDGLSALEVALNKASETISTLDSKLSTIKEKLGLPSNATIEDVFTAIDTLKNKLALANSTITQYDAFLTSLQYSIGDNSDGQLADKLNNLLASINTIRSSVLEYNKQLKVLNSLASKFVGDTFNQDVASGNLKEELSDLDMLISTLTGKIDKTTSDLNKLRELLGLSLDSTIEDVTNKVSEMKTDLQVALQTIEQYVASLDAIKQTTSGSSFDKNALQTQAQELIDGLIALKEKSKESEAAIQMAQESLDHLLGSESDSSDETTNLQDSIDSVSNMLKRLNDSINTLESDLDDLRVLLGLDSNATIADVKERIKAILANLDSSNEMLIHYDNLIDELQASVGSSSSEETLDKLNNLKASIESIKQQSAQQNSDLNLILQQIGVWVQTDAISSTEASNLKESVATGQQLISSITSSVSNLNSTMNAIKKALGLDGAVSAEELLNKVQTLKEEYSDCWGLLQNLQTKLQLDPSSKSLQEQIQSVTEKVTNLYNELNKVMDTLNQSLSSGGVSIKDFSEVASAVQSLQSQLNAAVGELAIAQQNNSIKDAEIKRLQSAINEKDLTVKSLQTQLAQSVSRIQELEKELQSVKSQSSVSSNSLAEQLKKNSELQKTVNEVSKQLKTKDQTIATLQNTISNNTTRVAKLESEIEEKTKQIEKLNKSISEKDNTITSLTTSIEETTSKLSKVSQQLEKARETIKELQSSVTVLEKEKESLKQQLANSKTMQNSNSDLQKKLTEMTALYSEQKSLSIKYKRIIDEYEQSQSEQKSSDEYITLLEELEKEKKAIEDKYKKLKESIDKEESTSVNTQYSKNSETDSYDFTGFDDACSTSVGTAFTSADFSGVKTTKEDGETCIVIDVWKTSTGVLNSKGNFLISKDDVVWVSSLDLLADEIGTESSSKTVYAGVEFKLINYVTNETINYRIKKVILQ